MKLTCVTATFNCIKAGNHERLIRCVESVSRLKTEHEHLIYDGASTDGTVELLRELEKKIPGLKVVSEPDTGIYNALNKGVLDAKGEWFYVLGADDYVSNPDVFDELVIDSKRADMLISPTYDTEPGTRLREVRPESIFFHSPYSHQGVIVRTALLRDFGGFDERYRICADYDFLLKVHESALRIDYRLRPFVVFSSGGASTADWAKTLQEAHLVSSAHFGITRHEWDIFARTRCFPATIFFRYLFHRDFALRTAARRMFWQWTTRNLRLPLYPLVVIKRLLKR